MPGPPPCVASRVSSSAPALAATDGFLVDAITTRPSQMRARARHGNRLLEWPRMRMPDAACVSPADPARYASVSISRGGASAEVLPVVAAGAVSNNPAKPPRSAVDIGSVLRRAVATHTSAGCTHCRQVYSRCRICAPRPPAATMTSYRAANQPSDTYKARVACTVDVVDSNCNQARGQIDIKGLITMFDSGTGCLPQSLRAALAVCDMHMRSASTSSSQAPACFLTPLAA